MNTKKNEDMDIWVFPEVSSESTQDDDDEEFTQEFTMETTATQVEVDKSHEILHTPENTAAAEAEALKAFYETKILSMRKLITRLNDAKSLIDNELFELMIDLVKNLTKKIIHKEIAADPELLRNMINDLKSQLPPPSGVVTVFLSQGDYDKLDFVEPDIDMFFKVQASLKAGDIIVKCNTSEIHAQLDDRLENLLSDSHE